MGTRNKALRELLAAIRLPTIPAVFQALSYSGGSPQLAKLGVLPIRTRKFEARYLSSAAHLVLTNDKRHAQQQQRQVQLSDVVRASMALRLPLLGDSLQHAPLPLLQTPLPSRQISFLRYLSAGPPDQRHRLPSAADADAALQDYLALKQRLDQVQRPSSIKTPGQVLKDLAIGIKNGVLVVLRFLSSVPARVAAFNAMSKEEWAAKKKAMWATVKHEAHHYWVGTKLLGYEVRIAARHALKAAQGKTLSRRERAQLTRTTADLFRLVPMIIIVVIPFLEFALPVLLRIFPNMLPSTFEDKLKKEEELKRRLSLRLELARFLQDTTAEMAKDIARRRGSNTEAAELDVFLKKAVRVLQVRSGQEVDNAEIIRFARLFNDELTLDNLERLQLVGEGLGDVSMCQFVGISPFGTDSFLRSRLRAHLATIKQDDCEIEEEGLENLTEEELRSACRARGIRTPFGEGAVRFMQRQLQVCGASLVIIIITTAITTTSSIISGSTTSTTATAIHIHIMDWLDLSLHRGLPSSLLLLSRAFTITAAGQQAASRDVGAAKDAQYAKLKETLGVLPEEVVDVVSEEQLGGSGVEALQKRLDFLKREEEAIRAELERTAAAERAAAAAAAASTASSKAAADIMHAAAEQANTLLTDAQVAVNVANQAVGQVHAAMAAMPTTGASAVGVGAGPVVPGSATSGAVKAPGGVATGSEGVPVRQPQPTGPDDEGMSDEEAAQVARLQAELKTRQLVASLVDLVTSSAVTKERRAFLDLMRNEMNRVSSVLAKTGKGSSTGTMSFSARGLEVAKDPVVEPGQPHAPGQGHESEVPSQLGERVSRMLASIEQELDSVETKIGRRLHVLDTDQDGMVTHEELEQAMGFLRAQMDPDQLQQLLVQLREAASKGAASQPTTAIAVSVGAGGSAAVPAVPYGPRKPRAASATPRDADAARHFLVPCSMVQVSELLKLASEQQDNGGELGDMNKARK
ncbi:hypothetical protein QJQ45_005737 [Haematococcus lacustris]|nr:hypothetical protein QJQ45_005737 [Haematococcus lacustris]